MRNRGFTVIELLVVVAVLAIVGALAFPSFSNAYLTNRLASYSNSFVANANYARSEAIKRNASITLCASTTGTSCTSSATSWQAGWIVMCPTDSTGANCVTGGTSTLVLQKQEAINSSYKFTTTDPASNGYSIVFPANGVGITVGSNTSAQLKLCRMSPAGEQERVITITTTGRTSVSTTRTGTC